MEEWGPKIDDCFSAPSQLGFCGYGYVFNGMLMENWKPIYDLPAHPLANWICVNELGHGLSSVKELGREGAN